MKAFKFFFSTLWLLCHMLLIMQEANAGQFKDFYTCYVTHVCDCGLLDQYNQCFIKAPEHLRHVGTEIFREYYPGNFSVEGGLIPFTSKMCKDRENEIFFQIWDRTEKEMRAYERKMVLTPTMIVDSVKTQTAKACVSPLISRCIEYGNACR